VLAKVRLVAYDSAKMKISRLWFPLLVVFSISGCGRVPAQTHPPFKDEHWNGHFGIFGSIVGSNSVLIGSAFVYGPKKEIVTCAHVAQQSIDKGLTNWVYLAQGLPLRRLKFGYLTRRYDLAMFTADGEIPGEPMTIGDFKKIRPGDRLHYYGFDTKFTQTVKMAGGLMNEAIVRATGSALNGGIVEDFLEFDGVGIPGYSGGPVFNEKGELVAMMREAWNFQGVRGGPIVLVNRAFSLEFLRISEEPIVNFADLFSQTNSAIPQSTVTNKSRMSLLDALDSPRANQERSNK
jgi:S1-C subfamily serine protease